MPVIERYILVYVVGFVIYVGLTEGVPLFLLWLVCRRRDA